METIYCDFDKLGNDQKILATPGRLNTFFFPISNNYKMIKCRI